VTGFFYSSAREVYLTELWDLERHRNWNPKNDPGPDFDRVLALYKGDARF